MNAYAPKTPRVALAIAALTLSVATMAVMVAAPASMKSDAAAVASREPAIEVTIRPSRIDVVATRELPASVALSVSQLESRSRD